MERNIMIKLINRKCLVEKFTDSLVGGWGKLTNLGKKGADAIKRRRSGEQPGAPKPPSKPSVPNPPSKPGAPKS